VGIGAVAIRGAHAEYTPQAGYPTVDRSTIWVDTVRQGDIAIEVRGLGMLTSPTTVEVRVAETQMKDVKLGQAAAVDLRKSSVVVKGRVTGIRPGVLNGTVTVDVQVQGVPPALAQVQSAVDATIQVAALTNVVYVGRPVLGKANAAATIFRIEPDGNQAVPVKVEFGRTSVNKIEVRSGLQPGDKVIVSDMSHYDVAQRVYLK
jgi:HlyD family secretion protein